MAGNFIKSRLRRLEWLEARTPPPTRPPEHRERVRDFLNRLAAWRRRVSRQRRRPRAASIMRGFREAARTAAGGEG
jgi:hypothetical protein